MNIDSLHGIDNLQKNRDRGLKRINFKKILQYILITFIFFIVSIVSYPTITHSEVIFSENFESDCNDWVISNRIWEIGKPTSGPESAYGDSNACLGTILNGKYPYGPDSRLISPIIKLPRLPEEHKILLKFK